MAPNVKQRAGIYIQDVADEGAPEEIRAFNRFLNDMRAKHPERQNLLPSGEIRIDEKSCFFYPTSGHIGVSSRGGALSEFLASLKTGVERLLYVAPSAPAEKPADAQAPILAAG